MTTWKKIAALAVVVPLALTACGGDNGSNGSDGGDTGDGKLTVWAWDPAFNIYAINEAAKIYQQDNPDVEVEVIETPWDDLQTKLTTLAQSQEFGELPDIFLMQNNAFQKNV
ncbi:MAG TPA: extracellular solute-binding protein, partial [Arachnia sp.]|nr:extracellular solute-binding protein [Arachnia sp.]